MKYQLFKNKFSGVRSVLRVTDGLHVYETEDPKLYNELRKKALAAINRKNKNELIDSLGLKRVKGSVSGKTYLE